MDRRLLSFPVIALNGYCSALYDRAGCVSGSKERDRLPAMAAVLRSELQAPTLSGPPSAGPKLPSLF